MFYLTSGPLLQPVFLPAMLFPDSPIFQYWLLHITGVSAQMSYSMQGFSWRVWINNPSWHHHPSLSPNTPCSIFLSGNTEYTYGFTCGLSPYEKISSLRAGLALHLFPLISAMHPPCLAQRRQSINIRLPKNEYIIFIFCHYIIKAWLDSTIKRYWLQIVSLL